MKIKSLLFFICTFCCINISYGTLLKQKETRNWFKAFVDNGIITLTPTRSALGYTEKYEISIDPCRLHEEFETVKEEDPVIRTKKLMKIAENLMVNRQILKCCDSSGSIVQRALDSYSDHILEELRKFVKPSIVNKKIRVWEEHLARLAGV